MKMQSPPAYLERINTKVFFLLLFAYQLIFIFQGADLADAGFYGIFYQQIFNDPETVQYNFMFWFSGIAGGVFNYLFPDSGVLGLRIFAALTNTLSIFIVYRLLKDHLNKGSLRLGLILALLFLSNNPKEFHYNTLAVLLYVSTAYFLFKGLKENRLWKIALAGVFISLNAFTRLPNVLQLGLGIAILYYGYLNRTTIKTQARQIVALAAGFLMATGMVFLAMKLLGHLDIFINAVKVVFVMGKGGNAESQYGIFKLLQQSFATYISSLKYTLIVLAFLVVLIAGMNMAKKQFPRLQPVLKIFQYFMLALFLYWMVKDKLDNSFVLYLFAGTIMIVSMVILCTSRNADVKTILLMGCYILLVYPFGSSAGLFTVGFHTFWIALPIVIDHLYNTRSVSNELVIANKDILSKLSFFITESQLSRLRTYGVVLAVCSCLFFAYYYPYFDKKDRSGMFYPINNKKFRGIFTSKERADIVNELLTESSKYVKPGDPVLAYDCIPMYHYMTDTKPYMKNPWPYLYEPEIFRSELELARSKNDRLPVVIFQKIKTMGSGSDWPSESSMHDEEWQRRNKNRNSYINDFLQKNNYKEVWSNLIFKIYIPQPMNPAP
ncbi:MAG: glycosyltransferase family 39 protein [Chitinophagaceae bacterium]|nr:glycosyltransferase family 39 protein [Chitinophagaceae bacterium]